MNNKDISVPYLFSTDPLPDIKNKCGKWITTELVSLL